MRIVLAVVPLALAGCGLMADEATLVDDPKGSYTVTCGGVEREACLEYAKNAVAVHRGFYLGAVVLRIAVDANQLTVCSKHPDQLAEECRTQQRQPNGR